MPILKTVSELQNKAKENRRTIIEMLAKSKSGHPGGSLSVTDILTVLYYHEMKFDPKNPKSEERDRFVLCKGHAAPAQYAALADLGFFDKSHLMTLRQLGSILQGHPERTHTPGVETFTGSLGQGLSVASGMAMAFKLDKKQAKMQVPKTATPRTTQKNKPKRPGRGRRRRCRIGGMDTYQTGNKKRNIK
jgi:transketolase